MDLQRINVKFFGADFGAVPLETFIPIFNSWIQASDGEYYDIADYSHVHAGSGVLLIAHEANISIDETGGRRGLLYNCKQPLQGSNQEKLRSVFRTALEYCRRIEQEPSLMEKIKFRGDEALVIINDRLLAPNSEKTFDAVEAELQDLARAMYAGANFTLRRKADPKKRFSVRITTSAPCDIRTLLTNLAESATRLSKGC